MLKWGRVPKALTRVSSFRFGQLVLSSFLSLSTLTIGRENRHLYAHEVYGTTLIHILVCTRPKFHATLQNRFTLLQPSI